MCVALRFIIKNHCPNFLLYEMTYYQISKFIKSAFFRFYRCQNFSWADFFQRILRADVVEAFHPYLILPLLTLLIFSNCSEERSSQFEILKWIQMITSLYCSWSKQKFSCSINFKIVQVCWYIVHKIHCTNWDYSFTHSFLNKLSFGKMSNTKH